jgi:DNA-binding response OmpR family regulator
MGEDDRDPLVRQRIPQKRSELVRHDPARPRLLVTEPGVGYRLKEG